MKSSEQQQYGSNFHELSSTEWSWEAMQDGIWEKVDRKKRKRRFLLLLTAASLGGIFVLISVGMFLQKDQQNLLANQGEMIGRDSLLVCEEESITANIFEEEKIDLLGSQNLANLQIHSQETDEHFTITETNSVQKVVSPLSSIIIPQIQISQPLSFKPTILPLPSLPFVPLETLAQATPEFAVPFSADIKWSKLRFMVGFNSFHSKMEGLTNEAIDHSSLEKMQVGMQLAVRYEHSFSNPNFYVGSGLEFTQLNSRFEHYSEKIIKVKREISLIPWGLILPREYAPEIYREVEVPVLQKRTVVHHNQHRLLNIPLYIGYRKDFRRFDSFINAGSTINIINTAKGKIADRNGEVIFLEDQSYFKSNVGISLFLEGGIEYPLNDNISFSGSLGWSKSLNNWVKAEQQLNRKMSLYQFNFGVGYRF